MSEHDQWEEPSEEELAEAAALARALERGTAEEPPEDALQAAALLNFSRDGGELSEERAEKILADVFSEAKVRRPEAASPWWRWLVPASLVGVAATAAVLITINPGVSDPTALPTPSRSLLQAQAAATTGDPGTLDDEMNDYRNSVLANLEQRYR